MTIHHCTPECDEKPRAFVVVEEAYSERRSGCPTCKNPDYRYTFTDPARRESRRIPICPDDAPWAREHGYVVETTE